MEKLPGSKSCYVCGTENPISSKLEFFIVEEGVVRSEFLISEQYAGYPGMAHGGNIAAILDEIAGRALTTDDPSRFMVTSELKIKYLHPVPTNTPLVAIGKTVKKRGRTAVAHSQLNDLRGLVLAECDAFFVDVTEKITQGLDPEAVGWKVYDE